MVAAVVAANVAFVLLGASFDYPAVLRYPDAMARFQADAGVIGAEFALLALGAALLAPIAWLVDRRTAWLGILAAAVQVVGLLRWPLVVPHLTDVSTFHTLNLVLGVIVGETLGYLFTAAWTAAIAWRLKGFLKWLGVVSAVMIASGVVPALGLVNFAGYLAWSVWLLVLAFRSSGSGSISDRPSRTSSHERDVDAEGARPGPARAGAPGADRRGGTARVAR
ncbi:hypothetical protein Lesp02_33610 [Lentzea sp. NBRC 105346]|nr:hypothetical protein Lesp02_33610 [Lentzea sp. NBRC 105346]